MFSRPFQLTPEKKTCGRRSQISVQLLAQGLVKCGIVAVSSCERPPCASWEGVDIWLGKVCSLTTQAKFEKFKDHEAESSGSSASFWEEQ